MEARSRCIKGLNLTMHRLLYVMLIPLLWFIFKPGIQKKKINLPAIAVSSNKVFKERLKNRRDELLAYAKQKGYNTSYAFLVDMKISSGSNRFFVCDLKKDSVLASGLVTHGYGMSGDTISFSNTTGSNCTSLGKYKIGNAYHGHFGLAYKLYGLDNTNSNAINRFVVLHSHACVPVSEVAPQSILHEPGMPYCICFFFNGAEILFRQSRKTYTAVHILLIKHIASFCSPTNVYF